MATLSSRFSSLILLAMLNALSLSAFAQAVHALDYDTPAYVDFEFSEIAAPASERTISINLYRTGDFRQSTTVEFVTVEGTAEEGRDYKGTGGTLTFKPGEGYKTIYVDTLKPLDSDRAFQVKLTAPASTILLRDTVNVTLKATAQPIGPLRLEITRAADGTVVLSWDGDSNCALERSSDPGAKKWETVSCSATVTQNHCEVTQPANEVFYAYRLRQP